MTETLRMVASLAGIIALIFALAWLSRRSGWLRGTRTQHLRLIGTQHLGQTRACLALIEVENTRLVLGVTATQITLLHTLPAQQDTRVRPETFAQVLHTQQEP